MIQKDSVTVAQVGIGAWGQNLLKSFVATPQCYLKVCCDQRSHILDQVQEQYSHSIHVTSDFEEVLKDATIEAVILATHPASHATLAIQALNAGKHVFVEKPLALSVEDGERMLEAARRNKKWLMVGHLLLYHPAVRKLKSYIDEGVLGDIHYLYSTRVNLGQIREEENALWSLTAHDISVAMYLLGQKPQEVISSGRAYLRSNIQDVVFVALHFKPPVMSHIHASWLDPHKVRKFTVVGSQKMAVFDDMEHTEKIKLYDKGVQENLLSLRQGDIYIPRIDLREPLRLEAKHFIDCILTGKEPFTNGENGLDVLKVLTAAQQSLDQHGKPIRIA